MSARPSLRLFPADVATLESSGVQWGLSLSPFAAADESGRAPTRGTFPGAADSGIPRCTNCYGYLCSLCDVDQWFWTCVLCNSENGFTSSDAKRVTAAGGCPEIASDFVDLEIGGDMGIAARPVYVAAVDLCCSEDFLELVKSSLLAALEALVPGSLFGLVTFSHRIGLYDIQGPIPIVKYVLIPPETDAGLPVQLEDVIPLLSFLAPVETCKDRIATALEALKPSISWERDTPAGQELDCVLLGGRGFGAAMTAVIDYLGSEYGSTFALARVFAFLSGIPDYGPGQLDSKRYGEQYASRREDADRALLPEQTPFYKELAAVAVQSGVCVDIFAVTDEYSDLASLKFLSIESGGSLFLYGNTNDSTLPQDMYRMLSCPYAFNCVLRIRTSSDFKLGTSYGHFFPDPQYENVQHIICCDSFASYAYDFDFTHSDGFTRHTDPAYIQMVFQYSVIEPIQDADTGDSSSSVSYKFCLKRRLRLRTLQYGSTVNLTELYDSVDVEIILSILVHKVIQSSLEEGVREGRHVLLDWLAILCARYSEALAHPSGGMISVDVNFTQCPELQMIPRLVFALLRNPLLRLHEEGVHPDYRIYLQCLFSALDPASLVKAIYPVLSSYATLDTQAFPRHSLSRAAITTSGSPIFLLDAFTTIIVFYLPTSDPALLFPPPHDCLLRTTINKIKQERCITPKLIFLHGGRDDSTPFESYLIEEQDVDGSMATSGTGFISFLESVAAEAAEVLRDETRS